MLSWNLLLGAGAAGSSAEGGSQSMLPTLITFGLIFVVFYFLIIRPQSKRQKATQNMIKAIKKGDRVQTIGGVQGTIQSVKAQTVILRISDNTDVEFVKSAISSTLTNSEEVEPAESEKPSKTTAARKPASTAKKDSEVTPKKSTRTKK